MLALLLIVVPLIALVIWAVVFDLKRRRRHAGLTSHDISSAARQARAAADARGGAPGGNDSGPAPGM
jgi:cytochrome c-type biogenesis protein CcmH/NrfF